MQSGQTPNFVWKKKGNSFNRALNGKIIRISQENGELKTNSKKIASETLRLEDDLQKIYEKISIDDFMKKAIKDYQGMRITKSDVWETTACFIISANNSIPNIANSVQKLMQFFGNQVEDYFEFPAVESIAKADLNDLRKTRIGFRAKYLKKTANIFSESDFDFKSKEEAKEFLLNCPGIGEKVSECICLFGYGFLNSFPIDVWMKRAMQAIYFDNQAKLNNRQLYEKANELFGNYQGYAQQYLFYEFMSKKRKSCIA